MARVARLLSLLLFTGVLGFYAWQFRPSGAAERGGLPQPQVLRQLMGIQKRQLERLADVPEAKEVPLAETLGALSEAMSAAPRRGSASPQEPALFRSEPALSDTNSLKVVVRTTSMKASPAGAGRAVLSDGTHRYEIVSPSLAPQPARRTAAAPPPEPRSRRRWAYASLLGTVAVGVGACAWARRRLLNPSPS